MRVNEIFYSLQGEGRFVGTPAIFIRFSGCNLRCGFCDTEHEWGEELTEEEIVERIGSWPARHVVITGGEPALQLTASLVDRLHAQGKFVQIETNGSVALPENCEVDWITCSPKELRVVLRRIDELKVVYRGQDMSPYSRFEAREYYLQPCDVKDEEKNRRNISDTINYIKSNPKWKLSLQTQKILKVR
ncbi:MAG: 7-carboxy-7-deazaguanine synthase QueE [Bacteroides sp.]|nr:7-carboxy-7-deazaguanine synthase QueE [Roseburia sp.]MCM1346078.1 7-carboxy-7-deazaguanine synthase QueE [Bacteroides sp.]MCM1421333.1 7-carboxy-7-deazaguanine synthase QueE [Bacteroides sp.]